MAEGEDEFDAGAEDDELVPDEVVDVVSLPPPRAQPMPPMTMSAAKAMPPHLRTFFISNPPTYR